MLDCLCRQGIMTVANVARIPPLDSSLSTLSACSACACPPQHNTLDTSHSTLRASRNSISTGPSLLRPSCLGTYPSERCGATGKFRPARGHSLTTTKVPALSGRSAHKRATVEPHHHMSGVAESRVGSFVWNAAARLEASDQPVDTRQSIWTSWIRSGTCNTGCGQL